MPCLPHFASLFILNHNILDSFIRGLGDEGKDESLTMEHWMLDLCSNAEADVHQQIECCDITTIESCAL